MAWVGVPRTVVLLTVAVWLAIANGFARASEESVDRATQTALSLDAHPERGAAQFTRNCARCHGAKAEGDAGRAIPALAGQRFAYVIRQLANFSGLERDSNTMHGVLTQIELRAPQAWTDIAAYVNRLPPSVGHEFGDGTQVALGRGIFHEQCAGCHRADAHGDTDGFVPSLRNQNYPYLASQLHKLRAYRRHNVDEDLVRFLSSLDEKDIKATADYLSRLQDPGAAHKVMRNNGVVVD